MTRAYMTSQPAELVANLQNFRQALASYHRELPEILGVIEGTHQYFDTLYKSLDNDLKTAVSDAKKSQVISDEYKESIRACQKLFTKGDTLSAIVVDSSIGELKQATDSLLGDKRFLSEHRDAYQAVETEIFDKLNFSIYCYSLMRLLDSKNEKDRLDRKEPVDRQYALLLENLKKIPQEIRSLSPATSSTLMGQRQGMPFYGTLGFSSSPQTFSSTAARPATQSERSPLATTYQGFRVESVERRPGGYQVSAFVPDNVAIQSMQLRSRPSFGQVDSVSQTSNPHGLLALGSTASTDQVGPLRLRVSFDQAGRVLHASNPHGLLSLGSSASTSQSGPSDRELAADFDRRIMEGVNNPRSPYGQHAVVARLTAQKPPAAPPARPSQSGGSPSFKFGGGSEKDYFFGNH